MRVSSSSRRSAFEGQLSGEVEREFDRPSHTAGSHPYPIADAFEAIRRLAENRVGLRPALAASSTASSAPTLAERGGGRKRFPAEDGTHPPRRVESRLARSGSHRRTSPGFPKKECAVRREDFAEGDRTSPAPRSARHVFQSKCVTAWLKRDDSRPARRSSLPIWLGRPQDA